MNGRGTQDNSLYTSRHNSVPAICCGNVNLFGTLT